MNLIKFRQWLIIKIVGDMAIAMNIKIGGPLVLKQGDPGIIRNLVIDNALKRDTPILMEEYNIHEEHDLLLDSDICPR